MTVKLQTEHYLEFLRLKGGCTGSSESATLLEITCRGSIAILKRMATTMELIILWAGLVFSHHGSYVIDIVKGLR